MSNDEHWETKCAKSPDDQHCAHWYDAEECHYCGDPPDLEELANQQQEIDEWEAKHA